MKEPVCLLCMSPICKNPACPTCKTCRNPKCANINACEDEPQALNGKVLHLMQKDGFCEKCRQQQLQQQCHRCRRWQSKEAFPSAKANRAGLTCIDCLHPPCRNAGCKTCKSCRNVSCKAVACVIKPKPLQGRAMQGIDDTAQYECDRCLFPCCSSCGKEMTHRTRVNKKKSVFLERVRRAQKLDVRRL